MKVELQVRTTRRALSQVVWPLSFLFCLPLFTAAQQTAPGRGASSAQDLARLTSLAGLAAHATSGADPADQVCARFAAGSITSPPPELQSQNGVLEVTMKYSDHYLQLCAAFPRDHGPCGISRDCDCNGERCEQLQRPNRFQYQTSVNVPVTIQ